MNNSLKAYIALIFMCIAWAFSFISTKVVLVYLSPVGVAFLRFAIASSALAIILIVKKVGFKVNKEDFLKMMAAGFFGVFTYFFFENYALMYLSASVSAIFLAAVPVFAIVADAIFMHISLTKKKVFAVSLSLIGVILVAGGCYGDNSNMFIGVVLIVGAILSWVIYGIMLAKIDKKVSTLKTTFYQTFMGTLAFGICSLFMHTDYSNMNSSAWLNLFFLGVVCSAVGYLIYNYAAKKLGNVTCTMFLNIMPAITIVGEMFILKTSMLPVQIVGSVIILSSIFLVVEKKDVVKSVNKEKI